ncbi:MAG: spore cortex-lytic protein [Ruminococcaceae bacterium]|nr:spore cortex-lytic protein [Oscillospiraceae bacterium]
MPIGGEPYIPEYITVHLGTPASNAPNVTVSFADYIKNVASSEIYPTWPEDAIRANVYAQTSFALNRIYNEWYRSMGYDFDITNSTAFDQSFVNGRDIFDNISRIVDDQFNSYVRRQGNIEPLFTAYCDGVQVSCAGLSQTGTVTLANRGLSPFQILQYYYGNDIGIVENAPVRIPAPSYPGRPLSVGDSGNEVQGMQARLNRISRSYPAIPRIDPVNGVFNQQTQDAVRKFQQIFGLTPDGIVGNATWNRINYIYVSVKRLAELTSEGLAQSEILQQYPGVIRPGDRNSAVMSIQYYLSILARFYNEIPPVEMDGIFGSATESAVRAFQRLYGLPEDGIVGRQTWQALDRAYTDVIDSVGLLEGGVVPYPGEVLARGSRGENVRQLQEFLSYISSSTGSIPNVAVDGVFGPATENSVRTFQRIFGLAETGVVGAATWNAIASEYAALRQGETRVTGQAPGADIGIG